MMNRISTKLTLLNGLILLAALAVIPMSVQTLLAQANKGMVTGLVTNPSGRKVVGATLELTNKATHHIYTTTTDASGDYLFDAVEWGQYDLKVTAQGFEVFIKTDFVVQNERTTLDVQLNLNVAEVPGEPTLVRGGSIDANQMADLPFALRNPVALALTLPGVSSNRYGPGIDTFPINGARPRSNNFLIDSVQNSDIFMGGQGPRITNPDAVREVVVQSSNYDLEFGRAGGGIVNVITKSGSNKFHGSLLYLLDSTRDDAITNTQKLNPEVQQRGRPLPGTDEWFAGTFGGPIIQDRTWFFGGYQERRQHSVSQSTVTTLSSTGRAKLRSLFKPGVNKNVETYLAVTNGIDAIQNFFAQDLGSGRSAIEFGTAFVPYAQSLTNRQGLLRVDHKLGDNDQLMMRYLYDDQREPKGGSSGFMFPDFITSSSQRYHSFVLKETHRSSPILFNQFRLGYNRTQIALPLDPTNPLGTTLPSISITGISTNSTTGTNIGISSDFPQEQTANTYILDDTITYLRGNHTIRFGLQFLKQQVRHAAPLNDRGSLVYGSSSLSTSSTSSTTYSAFANFVDDYGGTGSASRSLGSSVYYPNSLSQSYFIQDHWQVGRGLTVLSGLRYEYFGTPFNSLQTPAFTELFNINPGTFEGPFNQPNWVSRDLNNIAPSLGFAYALPSQGNRTIFRGGVQFGYDGFYTGLISGAAASAPNVFSAQVTSTVDSSTTRGLARLSTMLPSAPRAVTALDPQNGLLAPNLENPYYVHWSLGIQHELSRKLTLDIALVRSRGIKLFATEDLNPVVPSSQRVIPEITPAVPSSRLSTRVDALQGPRIIRTNGGSSNYHATQILLTHRFTKGFAGTLSYTHSKLTDNVSDAFAMGPTNASPLTAVPSRYGGLTSDRAVSTLDRTHRASLTYVYELPFLREHHGIIASLAKGWQISGVTTFETGVPFSVLNGVDADGIGDNFDRPDFNSNGKPGVRAIPATATSPSSTGYVNPDVIIRRTTSGNVYLPIDPTTAQYIGLPSGSNRTGNLGRNTLRTADLSNWDVSLMRRVSIADIIRLEFRVEFYNLLNHPRGTSISPFASRPQSISADVLNSPTGQFLNTTGANVGGRVIRYQLKLTF